MNIRFLRTGVLLLVVAGFPAAASADADPAAAPESRPALSADASAADLTAALNTLIAETNAVVAETEALEKVLRERDTELLRLQEVERGLNAQLNPTASPDDSPPATPGPEIDVAETRDALVAAAKDRIVLIHGGEALLGAGFLAAQGEVLRVFVAAPFVSGEESVTVKTLDGTEIPVGADLSCPSGADLVCLRPEGIEIPPLAFATSESLPGIGAPVVVLVTDPESQEITGTPGTIRGVGPDTWELDANLTPDMNGAPVLAVRTGEVIGIVSPQVAGVAADWAIGTRHESTRSFAARTDRMRDWQTIDLERFAKEAAYIDRYNDDTHLAWLAHQHVLDTLNDTRTDGDGKDEEWRKEIEDRSGEQPIARVMRWSASYENVAKNDQDQSRIDSREAMKNRLRSIYRTMEKELRDDNRDISDKFTPYHAQVYGQARQWRQNGIDELATMQAELTH